MVFIRRYLGVAAIVANIAAALPQPSQPGNEVNYGAGSYDNSKSNSGYDSKSSQYGSNNSESNNSGYDSSKDMNKGSNNSGNNKGYDNSGYDNSEYKTTTSSAEKETSTSSMKEESTTSSAKKETSTSYMKESSTKLESSSTKMYESTTTKLESSKSTSTAAASSTSIKYGSGSMNSGSSSNPYEDCVAQCIASFSPTATPSSVNSGSSGSAGTGATKTVIVAPSQGVLRYVPFAVNASVGDTIKFVWKAGPHTVTKSSSLQPCNASADALFDSTKQDVGFEFTQAVTSTEPTFFFCGLPNHCQKGMYGVINPPSNLNAPTSASGMMQSLKAKDADLKAYAAITDAATKGSNAALWGGSIELSSLPEWAQTSAAANILYTRNVLAANPELLKENGFVDMTSVDTTPMMVPKDMADALKDAAVSSPPNETASPANAAGASGSTSTAASVPTGGASMSGPRAIVALAAVVATVLML